jgi:hypothetical protein
MQKQKYSLATPQELFGVAVPQATSSYVPVSNDLALTSIRKGAANMGLNILGEELKLSTTGQIATGRIFLGSPDSGLQRCMGFINSYDKSKKFGLASGANVMICSNGMFTSEIVHMRKHTGNILEDMQELIQRSFEYLEVSFRNALDISKYFQNVKLEQSAINEIIGQLVLEEQLLKNEQLSIVKHGLKFDEKFNMRKEPTMWNLYNIVTEALKDTHPADYMSSHVKLNRMFEAKVKEWDLPGVPSKWMLDKDGNLIRSESKPVLVPEQMSEEAVEALDMQEELVDMDDPYQDELADVF